MRRAVAAALAVLALASPATADERLLRHGTVDADLAYAGCVVTQEPAHWCLVAQRDAGGVRLLVASLDDRSVAVTTTHPSGALVAGTALGRDVLSLAVDGHPLLGDVSVRFYAAAAMASVVTNDTCVPLPLHVELTAQTASLSLAAGTSGTFAGIPVSGYDRCGAAVAVGPSRGLWRMTVA